MRTGQIERTAIILVLAVVVAGSADAQQATGSLDDVARIKGGEVIYVSTAAASDLEGTFVKIEGANLTIAIDGQARNVAVSELRHVSRRGDSLRNGALFGAAFGATTMALQCLCGPQDGEGVFLIGANALIFSGVGVLVDYLIRGRTTIYQAAPTTTVRFSPLLVPHRRGVQLSFAF